MSNPKQTFKKAERLSSKKIINSLFANRDTNPQVKCYPFILSWQKAALDTNFPAQILLVTPKRQYRKTVERNRIKRQLRNIYRLNKHEIYYLLEEQNMQLALALIFVGRGKFDYNFLEEKFTELIELFREHIKNGD